jgi:hypothetical protein
MKLRAVVIVLLTASAAVAQNTQTQRQGQQQNVGNTTTNSHNLTSNAAGGAGGNATGGQGGTASASNAGEQNSQVSNYQDTRQTATAYAPPAFHTSPCVKAWGAGAQAPVAGLSLGGGKVDKGCDIRETAAEFASQGSVLAYCKVMITEPSAKKAGVTLEDCMAVKAEPTLPPPPPAAPSSAVLPQIVVPPPQLTVNLPPWPEPAVAPPPAAPAAVAKKKIHGKPCVTPSKDSALSQ